MINQTGDYLTIEKAAELSGFSAYYIRKLARSGKIRAAKWGAAWMIDRPSLLSYKEQMEALGEKKHRPHSLKNQSPE